MRYSAHSPLFRQPHCRHCQRKWSPSEGKNSERDFCDRCATDRKGSAIAAFGLRPLTQEDIRGKYLPPKATRRSR